MSVWEVIRETDMEFDARKLHQERSKNCHGHVSVHKVLEACFSNGDRCVGMCYKIYDNFFV